MFSTLVFCIYIDRCQEAIILLQRVFLAERISSRDFCFCDTSDLHRDFFTDCCFIDDNSFSFHCCDCDRLGNLMYVKGIACFDCSARNHCCDNDTFSSWDGEDVLNSTIEVSGIIACQSDFSDISDIQCIVGIIDLQCCCRDLLYTGNIIGFIKDKLDCFLRDGIELDFDIV